MNIVKILNSVYETKLYYDFALGDCRKQAPKLIKEIRNRYQWTQMQLADLLKCTDGYVSKIENSRKQISVPVVLRLLEIVQEMEKIENDIAQG